VSTERPPADDLAERILAKLDRLEGDSATLKENLTQARIQVATVEGTVKRLSRSAPPAAPVVCTRSHGMGVGWTIVWISFTAMWVLPLLLIALGGTR
jgi:hypothetical protein